MRQKMISKPLGTPSVGVPLGGPGSGNWGHAGRKGKRGGSLPRGEAVSIKSGKDWTDRYKAAAGKEHPEAEEWKAPKSTYFRGDPMKASMKEIWEGSSEAVRDLAKKTGIIALDDETYDYVGRLMEEGKLRGVTERLKNNPESLNELRADKVADIMRATKADHIALEEAVERSTRGDLAPLSETILKVTDRFEASLDGKLNWYDSTAVGIWYSDLRNLNKIREARGDPSELHRAVAMLTRTDKEYLSTELHNMLAAAALNEAARAAGGKGLFNAADMSGTQTMARRGDSFVYRVSSDAGRELYLRRLSPRAGSGISTRLGRLVGKTTRPTATTARSKGGETT